MEEKGVARMGGASLREEPGTATGGSRRIDDRSVSMKESRCRGPQPSNPRDMWTHVTRSARDMFLFQQLLD